MLRGVDVRAALRCKGGSGPQTLEPGQRELPDTTGLNKIKRERERGGKCASSWKKGNKWIMSSYTSLTNLWPIMLGALKALAALHIMSSTVCIFSLFCTIIIFIKWYWSIYVLVTLSSNLCILFHALETGSLHLDVMLIVLLNWIELNWERTEREREREREREHEQRENREREREHEQRENRERENMNRERTERERREGEREREV